MRALTLPPHWRLGHLLIFSPFLPSLFLLFLSLLPGVMILTGVNNVEAFAIGTTFGVGFEYTVGAGVIVATGCPFNEYNGILMFVRAHDFFFISFFPVYSPVLPPFSLRPLMLIPLPFNPRSLSSRRLCLVRSPSWVRASTSEQATLMPSTYLKLARTARYGDTQGEERGTEGRKVVLKGLCFSSYLTYTCLFILPLFFHRAATSLLALGTGPLQALFSSNSSPSPPCLCWASTSPMTVRTGRRGRKGRNRDAFLRFVCLVR